MFVCSVTSRRIAEWILAIPVPDPDLQYELIGWAMGLLWFSEIMERWRAVRFEASCRV
jgi:hypothetical protein